jgi:hypothetical protein
VNHALAKLQHLLRNRLKQLWRFAAYRHVWRGRDQPLPPSEFIEYARNMLYAVLFLHPSHCTLIWASALGAAGNAAVALRRSSPTVTVLAAKGEEVGATGIVAAAAGLAANPVVLWSLYTLKTTGSGLPPGPAGLLGAAEGG